MKLYELRYRPAGDTEWCISTRVSHYDPKRRKTYTLPAGYFPAEVLSKISKGYEFSEAEIRNIIDNALASMKRCLDMMMA